MGKRNPWVVENIEAFCFYCCPECDFKSKDGDHFKRHALESHHKAKSFFIKSKDKRTEKTTSIKCIQVKTDSEHQDKINEGLEDFVPSDIKVEEESLSESEGEEFVRLSEQKAKNLNLLFPDFITNEDLESFDDDETVDAFEEKLKTLDNQKLEDNVEELDTFDGENYENITDTETSDNETFEGMDEELESYDNHVEKTLTFNDENSENVKIFVKKYFPDTDEVEDLVEIENQKIQENLLSEKFSGAKLEKPEKEKKSISRKTGKSKDITDAETSDDKTFDAISEELKTFDKHDVEKSQTFNKNMKKGKRKAHHWSVPDDQKVAKKAYVPTGTPRGRPAGSGTATAKKYVPSGKPRGRPSGSRRPSAKE